MDLDELREAYRSTWLEWTRRTDALQQTIDRGNPDAARLELLLLAVEQARAAHNESRDRLARVLGHAPSAPDEAVQGDLRVRTMARLMWELAGRPAGTAESDWKCAESILETAAAGSR